MRSIFLIVFFTFGISSNAFSYHNFFFRDAGDITSGLLPNARLDPTSVTLQGNQIDLRPSSVTS